MKKPFVPRFSFLAECKRTSNPAQALEFARKMHPTADFSASATNATAHTSKGTYSYLTFDRGILRTKQAEGFDGKIEQLFYPF